MKKKLLFLFLSLFTAFGTFAQDDEEDMLFTPLTLEVIGDKGEILFYNYANGPVFYKENDLEPLLVIESKETKRIDVKSGFKIRFYGDNSYYSSLSSQTEIYCSTDCYIYGNIMSLIHSEDFFYKDTLTQSYAFNNLFANKTMFKNHPTKDLVLPATILSTGCYQNMFLGCTGLTKAPKLPATTLTYECYRNMFNGCTGLTKAPELPATNLAKSCYYEMFNGCTGLVEAPALPATKLAPWCYRDMFRGCTSLNVAPILPATILSERCYYFMFDGCSGLTKAPELPATIMANGCYEAMFSNCISLSIPPVLPATTLADSCYQGMFSGCLNLNEVPVLPATTLAKACYWGMFYNCSGLMEAPILPATTLATGCYSSMFSGCTGLTTTPLLPASELAQSCYVSMFSNCSNLKSVICLATDISANNPTGKWLTNVSSTGTFYKDPQMSDWNTGKSGIPEGWTVVDYDMSGINAATAAAKVKSSQSFDLRGMKTTGAKKGLKVVDGKKVLTK